MKLLKFWPQIVLVTCIIFTGCTRDDICDPNEATTPLLIITFKNSSIPDEAKAVAGLTILSEYDEEIIIASMVTTDSIAIPLRTAFDDTQYKFIRAETNTTTVNTDVYKASYTREDVYINRACGFKTVFNELTFIEDETDPDNDETPWINQVIINQTNVENENQSHITIFH